jgi:hypothetical protein
MSNPWLAHVGEVINDRFPLLELLHSTDDFAIFRTEPRDNPKATILQLVRVDPEDAGSYISRWQAIQKLSNAHLLRIFDCGRVAAAEDGSALFLVTEEPDDILASVLAERALSEEETKQVAEALSDALDAMHRRGMVHGRLRPDTVFAIGDQIKLSGDGIDPAEDASAATDMNDLGLLILACLKQQVPGNSELPGVVASLPEPFRDIVERTLDPDPQKRWTAARVRSVLRGETPAELPVDAPRSIPLPRARKSWIYAGLTAAAVLLVAIGVDRARSNNTPQPQPAAIVADFKPTPAAPPAEAPRAAEPVRQTAPPARTEGRRARVAPPVVKERSSPGDHLVIVATYNRLADAEKRAHAISARWPKFPATVIAPRDPNPPYFVTIGANLSKEAAQRLQQRARAAGLPRDTYVTR